MKVVVQRVTAARVTVEQEVVGEIGVGLVVFAGASRDDTEDDLLRTAHKIAELRVFEDERGKMANNVATAGGQLLVVSQFTLYGDISRGHRPSFTEAMAPAQAEQQLERFVTVLRARGLDVRTGRFGADMRVSVENDGPVTILFDSRAVARGPTR